MSTLAGCSSPGTTSGRAEGTAGTSGAPSPAKSPANPLVPPLSTLPPARTPVLRVRGTHNYDLQILDARTVVKLANGTGSPPDNMMALALLLRVQAKPSNRSMAAPPFDMGIKYPSRKADIKSGELYGAAGTELDFGTNYLTKDQMLTGNEKTQGVDLAGGTLQANTVYYHWVWQLVLKKANLAGATLCESEWSEPATNCIPVGAINTASLK
ncbi:hypothetical protein ACIPSJ_09395 [Streptomyces sp. NPDC090088]|uniref:hypothetical protein n=1 Tax=Streptomyces sp. NPDC090088 TaxID=3365944 RepID=UPI0038283011